MNVHEDYLNNQAMGLSAADLMSLIQRDQVNQWKGEQPLKVEDYLRLFPALQEDVENVLVLIMSEIIQREARGHTIEEEEYLERFPHLSEQLKLQMEFHQALQKAPESSDSQDVPDHSSASSLHIGRVMAKMKMHHSRTLGEEAFTGTYQPAPPAEAEGTLIANRYKLRQQIGEGGMGTVWMADQTEPIKRKVAVKLIRVERNQSKTILARFEAERQAIALMDHPNIAKLLDAGTTGGGAPFFVMELVKGIPLNDFCDQHRLTISERLNLFMHICLAVQHAHQKGIIHRDLKPGNILVESHDGKPVPKIIDFGLAKATSSLQLTAHSLYTAFGSVMGTPAYMAPEQATFNAVDVDTRADVYALGVILYELLTGSTPITRESLKKAALDEMLRLVREQEAPAPSNRLSSSESTPSVAASRQIEPQKLGRFVKGELDWIVLKALSKERDRRYETANGFAKDIERFLSHEPVQAGPPSAWYRFRKFVRRNRGQVIAAGLVLTALVVGIMGTTWGLLEAKKQEQAARDAEHKESQQRILAEGERDEKEKARKQAVAEKERADREKAIAEAVKDFVTNDVFTKTWDPSFGPPSEIKARVLLEAAARNIEGRFKDQPEVEAAVRRAISSGFQSLGMASAMAVQLRRVLEICREIYPKDHKLTLLVLRDLGWLPDRNGDHAPESLAWSKEAYEGYLRTTGPSTEQTRRAAGTYVSNLLSQQPDEAMNICKKYSTANSANVPLASDRAPAVRFLHLHAVALQQKGKYDEAIEQMRVMSDRARTEFGFESEQYREAIKLYALELSNRRQDQLAEPLLRSVLVVFARVGGEHADDATQCRRALAGICTRRNDHQAAADLWFEVTEGYRNRFGAGSKQAQYGQRNAVESLGRANRLDIATTRAEARASSEKPDDLANAASLLSMVMPHIQDPTEAKKLGDRALQFLQRAVDRGWQQTDRLNEFALLTDRKEFVTIASQLGKDRPSVLPAIVAAAAANQRSLRKYPEAIANYKEAIRLQEIEVGRFPNDESVRETLGIFLDYLGATHRDKGDIDKALQSHAASYNVRMALLNQATSNRKSEYANQAAWSQHNQGLIYLDEKRYEKAAELFVAAAAMREKVLSGLPEVHVIRTATSTDYDWLGRTWERAGRWTDAETAYRKALVIREAIVAANFNNSDRRAELDWSRRQLAAVLVELGNMTEARDIYRKNVDLYRKTYDGGVHDALAFLGSALLRTGEWQEAETILKECVERREKQIPDQWQTFNAYSMYGGALFGLKRYAEAEPLLLKGFTGMKEREQLIPAYDKNRLTQSLDRLIDYYRTKNKPEEVAKWRAVRAKYSTANDKIK